MASRVTLGHWVFRERLDQKDYQEKLAHVVLLARLDHQDLLVLLAFLDLRDGLEMLVVKEIEGHQDLLV